MDYSPPAPVEISIVKPETAVDWRGRDIRSTLSEIDGERLTLDMGQSANVDFRVPPLRSGTTRSYLARTTGWYKILPAPGSQANPDALARLQTEPLAVSRLSVERANLLLEPLTETPD
jgi:hypothetical protein